MENVFVKYFKIFHNMRKCLNVETLFSLCYIFLYFTMFKFRKTVKDFKYIKCVCIGNILEVVK